MKLPNFLVIGAGKSGTTSLYFYLAQHPEIYLSPIKEVNFLAVEGHPPLFQGLRDEREAKACFSITTLEQYCKLFSGVSNEKAVGEISPYYLYSETAPERIYHYTPDAKLIAILRNPVDRAYSNYLHLLRDGREPLPRFDDALKAEELRIENNWSPSWFYRSSGYYYKFLSRYFERFDSHQIKIWLFEDYVTDPEKVVQEIFKFLGVDPTFIPDTTERYNISGIPKYRILHSLITKSRSIKSLVKPFMSKQLIKVFTDLRNSNLEKPPAMSLELRRELVEEYRTDIIQLQDLIQRDLSAWLRA